MNKAPDDSFKGAKSPDSKSQGSKDAFASPQAHSEGWRERVHEIIFEADTVPGKLFDIALLIAILISILAICLETVDTFAKHRQLFQTTEWVLTVLFTIEYILRLICVARPKRYALSFYGVIDLLSFLPAYLIFFGVGATSFAVLRSFRLLRVFRILKIVPLIGDFEGLYMAFWRSRGKIVVFFATVLVTVTIMGALMYEVEHNENEAFSSIPHAMYWAIVTMTTVGYGDIVPQTILGKFLSAVLILLGYSLIIVPSGFVSAEMIKTTSEATSRGCRHCMAEGHDMDANYCKYCGEAL